MVCANLVVGCADGPLNIGRWVRALPGRSKLVGRCASESLNFFWQLMLLGCMEEVGHVLGNQASTFNNHSLRCFQMSGCTEISPHPETYR